jgi:putative ABC transport system substrate-binding protein
VIRRREFITLLGGAAAWPLRARAQQSAMPVIGFLHSGSQREYPFVADAVRQGLRESGYTEGQNVGIEYRWANERHDQLPVLANELVRRPVSVIMAVGGTISVLAAKAATATIPIVFVTGADPVESGLVASLNRPGGNVTGVSVLAKQLDPKRFELLSEMVQKGATVAVLINPKNPNADAKLAEARVAASAVGLQLLVASASSETELDNAFIMLVQQRVAALLIEADPFFSGQREQIALLAVRHGLPTIYFLREYALLIE